MLPRALRRIIPQWSNEAIRPLLLEVQTLVSPTAFGTGRRSAIGWESARLNMVLATLATRLGLSFVEMDVYVNVAGGIKVADPAMDLAVVAALLSSHAQAPLPPDLACFGEIGLSGEVRTAARAQARVKEAVKLGFGSVIRPEHTAPKPAAPGCARQSKQDPACRPIRRIASLLDELPDIAAELSSPPPHSLRNPGTKHADEPGVHGLSDAPSLAARGAR